MRDTFDAPAGEPLPAYLKPVGEAAHYYGTLSYNRRSRCWTIKGEPCVTELAKRLFPGCDGHGRGEARFTAHRRIVGELNWLMMRYPLRVAERDAARWDEALGQAQAYAQARLRAQRMPQTATPPRAYFEGELRPFQQEGLAWLLANPRALLADEMGLGKTVQAIALLATTRLLPAMLVVPPHLVRNWEREIGRFLHLPGGVRVHVLRGLTPYELPVADVYIVHYLLLRGWKDVLPRLCMQTVIFDEIQELRRAGITLPILCLGQTAPEFAPLLLEYGVTQTVEDLETARALSDAAQAAGKRLSVHVKLDTGMGRLGFLWRDGGDNRAVLEDIAALCALPGLKAEGLFTHFSDADGCQSYTMAQLARFQDARTALENRGLSFSIYHCGASAAVLHYPQTHMDMVRPGIVLYGYSPAPGLGGPALQPVLTLKSRVAAVRSMPAGSYIRSGIPGWPCCPSAMATASPGGCPTGPRWSLPARAAPSWAGCAWTCAWWMSPTCPACAPGTWPRYTAPA